MSRKRCNLNSTAKAGDTNNLQVQDTCNPDAREKPHKPARSARWAMLNTFVDESARLLTPGAVTVWLILYRNADAGGLVKMTQSQIAERAPFAKRQAIDHLDTLERLGYLKVISRGSRNKGPSWLRISAVSTCGNPQPKTQLQHAGIRNLKPILNMRESAHCYMQDPATTTEGIRTKTPDAAKAALAEEGELRTKPVEIGGIK